MLTIIAILSIQYSIGCEAVAPANINLAIDIKKGSEIFYTHKDILNQRPSLSVEGCQSTAQNNKFVMIGVAQENPILTNEAQGFVLNEVAEVFECNIENSPDITVTQTSEARAQRLKRRRDFLNRCLEIQVTDFGYQGIQYPEKQPGCTIEKVSKESVNFSGAFCFFKPSRESTISIHPQIKTECRNIETLSEVIEDNVILEDFNLLLNTYIAGDASGSSTDLTAKSVTSFRLSYNPINEILASSDDFGEERPRWPTDWKATKAYLGELEIQTTNPHYDQIKLPFLLDARCERKCVEKVCSSSCDYAQPFAAQMSLYQIVNGKEEFIRQWYDGSAAPSQYQGFIHGLGMEIPKNIFEEGLTYKIKAEFINPSLEYAYFSGRVAKKIGLRVNHLRDFRSNSRINRIPHISLIDDLDLVPMVPRIQNLNFDYRPFGDFSRILSTFRSHLYNSFWPPSLERMCSPDVGSCVKTDQTAVELELEFTIQRRNHGRFVLGDMKDSRTSMVDNNNFKNRTRTVHPKLNCTITGANNNNDDDFDYSNF